jgi:hypothetical protein
MIELSKIVNINDNLSVRLTYLKGTYPVTGENRENWIKFIPLINWLFATYSKKPWKNNPEHPNYAFAEYQLCTIIKRIDEPDFLPKNRKDLIESIACILDVSPVLLYNDPNFPF